MHTAVNGNIYPTFSTHTYCARSLSCCDFLPLPLLFLHTLILLSLSSPPTPLFSLSHSLLLPFIFLLNIANFPQHYPQMSLRRRERIGGEGAEKKIESGCALVHLLSAQVFVTFICACICFTHFSCYSRQWFAC